MWTPTSALHAMIGRATLACLTWSNSRMSFVVPQFFVLFWSAFAESRSPILSSLLMSATDGSGVMSCERSGLSAEDLSIQLTVARSNLQYAPLDNSFIR